MDFITSWIWGPIVLGSIGTPLSSSISSGSATISETKEFNRKYLSLPTSSSISGVVMVCASRFCTTTSSPGMPSAGWEAFSRNSSVEEALRCVLDRSSSWMLLTRRVVLAVLVCRLTCWFTVWEVDSFAYKKQQQQERQLQRYCCFLARFKENVKNDNVLKTVDAIIKTAQTESLLRVLFWQMKKQLHS